MPRILLRHFRCKTFRLCNPLHLKYRRTEVTQLLRIFSLVCLLYTFDLQTGLRVEYALLEIYSLPVMSSCDSPSSWTVAPKHVPEPVTSYAIKALLEVDETDVQGYLPLSALF